MIETTPDATVATQGGVPWTSWLAPLGDAVVGLTMLRGTSRRDGHPLAMLVAGSQHRVQWIVDRCFSAPPSREGLGHVPAWRLVRTLRRLRDSADVTVARVSSFTAARLGFGDDYLPVPDWIGMRLDAPFDLAAIARRSHSVADDLRRGRNAGWSAEVSRHSADFDAFYRDMYVPFMRNRHQAEGYVRSARRLRRAFRRGGLLWIRRDGERTAGLLFEHRHDVLAAVVLGVAGGELRWLKAGAIGAIYAEAIEYARHHGFRAIDLRGSRPSLEDGLTRYKRKWGAAIYDRADVPWTTLVRWERMSPAVVELLTDTPLVFRESGGLSAVAVAHDDEDPAIACKRLGVPGLRRMFVLTPSSDRGTEPERACVPVAFARVQRGPRALLASAAG